MCVSGLESIALINASEKASESLVAVPTLSTIETNSTLPNL